MRCSSKSLLIWILGLAVLVALVTIRDAGRRSHNMRDTDTEVADVVKRKRPMSSLSRKLRNKQNAVSDSPVQHNSKRGRNKQSAVSDSPVQNKLTWSPASSSSSASLKASPHPSHAPPFSSASPSVYPEWWLKSWHRSEVDKYRGQMVGDEGLFPACKDRHSVVATYPFVEPKPYLANCKNPCWYEKKTLRCLPYIYLAGVAKCGTSDISRRLRMHHEFMKGIQKEFHWWSRFRFGHYEEDDPEVTLDVNDSAVMTFDQYVEEIGGEDLSNLEEELKTSSSSRKIFGDFSPSYFWGPQKWHVLDGNQGCKEPRIIIAQHIYHVFPAAKMMVIFRHPTPRLYSRFMSRIHRTPFLTNATVKDFHRWVVEGVKTYNDCFRRYSIRQCAYNSTIYKAVVVRLVEGLYPVFMDDWLRVWPRNQMLLMRTEDYAGREREHLETMFSFLGLAPLSEARWQKVMRHIIVNSGSAEYEKYGDMLPETKKVLDDFYQPFVQMFHDLLGEERFLWKDVYE